MGSYFLQLKMCNYESPSKTPNNFECPGAPKKAPGLLFETEVPYRPRTPPLPIAESVGASGGNLMDDGGDDSTTSPGSVNADIRGGETVHEILNGVVECLLSSANYIGYASRMVEGVWDDERARKYFVADRLEQVLADISIVQQNLSDAHERVLGDDDMTTLRGDFRESAVVSIDRFRQDDDGLTYNDEHFETVS